MEKRIKIFLYQTRSNLAQNLQPRVQFDVVFGSFDMIRRVCCQEPLSQLLRRRIIGSLYYRTMAKRKSSSDSAESPSGFNPPPIPSKVQTVFDSYESATERQVLLELRKLIFATAQSDDRIGPLTETLKWGEPAYLTEATKAGSTLRLGHSKLSNSPAMFVSCSTPLLKTLQKLDGSGVLSYHGLRDIAVPQVTAENKAMLQTCILHTLTYHLNKKDAKSPSPGVTSKKRTKTSKQDEE